MVTQSPVIVNLDQLEHAHYEASTYVYLSVIEDLSLLLMELREIRNKQGLSLFSQTEFFLNLHAPT